MAYNFPDYRDTDNVKGIANNNPGNIRETGIPWKGRQIPWYGDFERFIHIGYGIRALISNLKSYFKDSEVKNTVKGIISRWAPPHENPTGSYVKAVADSLKVAPTEQITFTPDTARKLARAIIDHENGQDASLIKDKDINIAISRYFDSDYFLNPSPNIAGKALLIGAGAGLLIYLQNQYS
jgi:hypothetical protein